MLTKQQMLIGGLQWRGTQMLIGGLYSMLNKLICMLTKQQMCTADYAIQHTLSSKLKEPYSHLAWSFQTPW
jgi:hypothetical protein